MLQIAIEFSRPKIKFTADEHRGQ